jgi:hypothetical protein
MLAQRTARFGSNAARNTVMGIVPVKSPRMSTVET